MAIAPTSDTPQFDIEQAVRQRYEAGAKQAEAALCCPTSYDDRVLASLPQEIIGCILVCLAANLRMTTAIFLFRLLR